MIEKKLIEEINQQTDIVNLVSEFVELAKKGKNYLGLCPFHQEKTPSFSVSPEKNIAKCMGCGEGGSPINFYRKIKNISFEASAYELADRAGIAIQKAAIKKDPNEHFYKLMEEANNFYQFYLRNSDQGQKAVTYLTDRGLSDQTINHFKIGYAPSQSDSLYQLLKDKNFKTSDMIQLGLVKQNSQGNYYDLFSDRVIFPITNPQGHIVGFSGRTLNPKETIKYINSPETPVFKKGELLYHFHETQSEIRKTKQVILYEGFFDVISSYLAGVKQGVATMGTALTTQQAKLLKSVSAEVIIAYDGDKAGQKAIYQAISILEKEKVKLSVLTIPEGLDPDEFVGSYGHDAYDALFVDHVVDHFAFRYQYFKSQVDLKNANDIQKFRTEVMRMLRSADVAVAQIYKQKLARDINVPVDSLAIQKEIPRKESTLPPALKKAKIIDKYERAERYLLLAMLRDKKQAQKIQSQLNPDDFADPVGSTIRIKIQSYYQDQEELILGDFLGQLAHDQREYVEDKLFSDIIWLLKLPINDEDIKRYVHLIKEAGQNRRLAYLNDRLKANPNSEKHVIERDQIIRQIKLKK